MIKRISIFAVLFIIFSGGFLVAQASDPAMLLMKAESAFKVGNELLQSEPESAADSYRTALNYYNSLAASGAANAGLYYNIANSYIRLDDLGNGILNYKRALLYSPNDSQILANLEYARGLQKNGFESLYENKILYITLFWKTVILIAANLIFWAALIFRHFGYSSKAVIIISALVLSAAAVFFIFDIKDSELKHGVVTAESTEARLGDSRGYEPAFDLPLYSGVEFEIKQRRVGWLLAELPDGELVWLEEADCGIVE